MAKINRFITEDSFIDNVTKNIITKKDKLIKQSIDFYLGIDTERLNEYELRIIFNRVNAPPTSLVASIRQRKLSEETAFPVSKY